MTELKFELLTQDQIAKIHSSSLRILEQVGVQINENDFLQFLARNGVNVDFNEKWAKMSSNLIEDCIKKAPKSVTLYARESKHNISLEDGRICAHPVGGQRTLSTSIPEKRDLPR